MKKGYNINEIIDKKFKVSTNGYDCVEVDTVFDRLIEIISGLENENEEKRKIIDRYERLLQETRNELKNARDSIEYLNAEYKRLNDLGLNNSSLRKELNELANTIKSKDGKKNE